MTAIPGDAGAAAPIRIGFSTQMRNPISRIIRWLTGSRASHAWLLVHDPLFHADLVLEASGPGFRLVPFKTFRRTNRVVALFDPRHPLDQGLHAAAKWLGEEYDYLGLLGMAVVLFGRWLRRKWRNPLRSAKAMFCSQAVVRVLRAARYPNAERLPLDGTTPQDLLDFFGAEKQAAAVAAP